MSNKKMYVAILNCERCQKTGAVNVPFDVHMSQYVYGSLKDGFGRMSIDGKTILICEECYKKDRAFSDHRKQQMEKFISGDDRPMIELAKSYPVEKSEL